MVSAASPRDFKSVAIDQHLTKIFSAILSGKGVDKESFFSRLDKYQAEAVKLKDVYLQGRVQSVRGTLYLSGSDFAEAGRCYYEARQLYAEAGNRDRVFGMDNNLGLLQVQRGNYEEAIHHFNNSIAQLTNDDPNRSFKLSMVQINMAMALLALFDFEVAHGILQQSLSNFGDLLEYVRLHSSDSTFVVEQRVFLGMAQLGIGELDEALTSASLAMEFAEHTNTVYTRLLALVLIIRLSETTSARLQGMTDILTQVDNVLAECNGDIYNFCLLREEARYHASCGSDEMARWYADRAIAMSIQLGSDELRLTAEAALEA